MSTDHAGSFQEHRGLLFTVAYELLGSAADAEDVLQESWLRWAAVDLEEVRDPRAYLVRTVSRQSLNALRSRERRREAYVGPWLPEPLLTAPDVADDVELADSVSMAMLVVLETLTPLERAAFVLREVFGLDYAEVAEATGRTPDAVRQLVTRARKHVEARRPRVDVGPEVEQVTAAFFAAAATGDVDGLLRLMAPDVVLTTDGGGKKKAALRPITGADKVARFLMAVTPRDGAVAFDWKPVNGGAAATIHLDGELDTVVLGRVVDGLVAELLVVRNPDKLGGMVREHALTRGAPGPR